MSSSVQQLDSTAPVGRGHEPKTARFVRGGYKTLLTADARRMIMLLVALGLLIAIFSALSGGREVLLSNLLNIATSGSLLGIVAVGEVVVMIAGGLDISVGSTAGLVSSVTAVVMVGSHENVAAGILAGLAVGVAAGLVNGLMVAYVGVNSVIATLATYSAYAGLALLVTGGQEIGIASNFFNVLGTGSALGVPYLVWVLIVVSLIGNLVMRYTDIGRQVYAVGGSIRAARRGDQSQSLFDHGLRRERAVRSCRRGAPRRADGVGSAERGFGRARAHGDHCDPARRSTPGRWQRLGARCAPRGSVTRHSGQRAASHRHSGVLAAGGDRGSARNRRRTAELPAAHRPCASCQPALRRLRGLASVRPA